MLKILLYPGGPSIEIVPAQDLDYIVGHFLYKRKTSTLDYRVTTAEKYYGDSNLRWVEVDTRKGPIRTPYEIVVDYRKWPKNRSWGKIIFNGDYHFPTALSEHKDAMIKLFTKRKLLTRNNPCPRISSVELLDGGVPQFQVQKAWYFDQVGTNLSIDYPLDTPTTVNGVEQSTIREWDIVQSENKVGELPNWKFSRLANTIGVAVGITAETKDGRTVIIRRKRSKKVAVYPNMWHLPFSFALSPESYGKKTDLKNFIKFDFGYEQAEELGLGPNEFDPLMPVAFCRDLVRGGKPQFFFEMRAKLPFEELRSRLRDSTSEREYRGKVEVADYKKDIGRGFSPELVCFLLLKSRVE